MSTIREHLEAIRDDIAYVEGALVLSSLAKDCHNHAVDALLELSKAKRTYNLSAGELADHDMRLVYDPTSE